MSLIAPFPYFGGKRSVVEAVWARLSPFGGIGLANAPHVGAIQGVFPLTVSRRYGDDIVTGFAFGLPAIRTPFVAIKFTQRLFRRASRATLCRSTSQVAKFVLHIFGDCIPSQVAKPVVCWIGIGKMAGLVLGCRRKSDKCQEDQSLNLASDDFAIQIKRDVQITIPTGIEFHAPRTAETARAPIIPPLSFEGPDRAIIASKVIGVAGNWVQFSIHSYQIRIPTGLFNSGGARA